MKMRARIHHPVERLRRARVPLALCLAVMSSTLMGAASCLAASLPSRSPCGMCEEQDRFVRLQSRPAEAPSQPHAVNYAHPVRFTPEDWARVLKQIRVQSLTEGWLFGTTKGPVIDAFTAEEIQFLSPTLSKAFAEARPDEVVVFGLVHSRMPALLEITTGSWFVNGDAIQLVLVNYRTAVALPGIRALLWEEPLRRQPGLRYELVPGAYQALVQSKDEENSLFEPARPSQMAIQYRVTVNRESPSGSFSSVAPLSAEPSRSLEDRLERLKQFWERGLITEEEYRMKRKELIDRF